MLFKIGDRKIGQDYPPYCIAEVGINHNGNIERAFEMITVAKKSGADAVKFQTFHAAEFCGESQKFTYKSQGKTVTESMLKMFQRYEFSREQWFELKKECDRQLITFMSTPQNRTDLDLLLEIGIPAIKVGSDDLTNIPLIRSYAEEQLPLILSSGMSDLAEIYSSINVAGGFDNEPVALLLCTSQYPTLPEEVNLERLTTLQNALPGITVGFSDHTKGQLASSLAVVLGATILEKHFTLDNDLAGPDHWFSEDPMGLKEWIRSIRMSHIMKGSPVVRPTLLELKNKNEYQRHLVAAHNINKGEIFSEKNIALSRVEGGNGFPPSFIDYLVTKPSPKRYSKGDPIEL
jgi:N,N'-diacetyllegionaminate synthase